MSNWSFPKITLKARREIALDSPDHLMPWGTRRDNSHNPRFNEKLYRLFPNVDPPLKILDLGCSGGGFVKDCFNDGCLAVGLEGSDFSKINRRAEWRTIPEFLFTCDVTDDFEVLAQTDPGQEPQLLRFDVVTCWEMMEHIQEQAVAKVALNAKKHLKPGGLWIMSISTHEETINGTRLHQTVQSRPWWIEQFRRVGFEHNEDYVRYFNTQFIRGPKQNAPGSFHLALSADKNNMPAIPDERWQGRLYDRWLGSLPQRFLSGHL